MLELPAKDPDYSSPWPAGTGLLHYRKDADTVTVDLDQESDSLTTRSTRLPAVPVSPGS